MTTERSAELVASAEHGYGVDSDCLCGRNFHKVRGLREHLTKTRQHHPRCYQNTGVPDDLPADLCDCRVLRMIERSLPPGTPAAEATQ